MRNILIGSFAACVLAWPAAARAQTAQTQQPTGRAVLVEVLIAHVSGDVKDEPGAKVDWSQRLAQWERDGRVAALARVRLATLDQLQASVQIGERVPVVVGSMRLPSSPRREPGTDAAPATARSYRVENVGTLVTATPRIDEGSVLLDLKVEQSRLAAPGPDSGGDAPPSVQNVSAKTSVRIPAGQTVLAGEAQTAGKESPGRTFILVSAAAGEGSVRRQAAANLPAPELPQLHVFHLTFAKAKETAKLIQDLFAAAGVKASFQEQSNSLVVVAGPEQSAVVRALIAKLDEAPK